MLVLINVISGEMKPQERGGVGEEKVRENLQDKGCSVKDISKEGKGIEIVAEKDGKKIQIEVKSTTHKSDILILKEMNLITN